MYACMPMRELLKNPDLPGRISHPALWNRVQVGKHTASNGVKWAACSVSGMLDGNGRLTPRETYRMRPVAQMGCGMVTNQGGYPDPRGEGQAYNNQLDLSTDACRPGLEEIAHMIHTEGAEGALAIQQILHAGRYGGLHLDYCMQPSVVPTRGSHMKKAKEMTKQDIYLCVKEHADAAERAIKAGFDGIELTAFMGYMLANWLSPATNKRDDEYGGSVEKRCRFMYEVIDAIKQRIGDKILGARLCGIENMDHLKGSTPDECLEYMVRGERAGLDYMSVVVGWHESRQAALSRDVPEDHWLYLAERAQNALKIPVAFGPNFDDPELANQAMQEGKFKLWELCRSGLAYPTKPREILLGEERAIIPCLGDMECLGLMMKKKPYRCTVNPALGHEGDPAYQITVRSPKERKDIMIVGGGPAGINCAITARRCGHHVTLYEQSNMLGGQVRLAAREQRGGHKFDQLLAAYEYHLQKLGVDIKLETQVNRKMIGESPSNVVVVATGAHIDMNQVPFPVEGPAMVNAFDVLSGNTDLGDRVAVIGGDRIGIITAQYTQSQGKETTLIHSRDKIGEDVIVTMRWRYPKILEEMGARIVNLAEVQAVNENRVILSEGEIEADTVVWAGPRSSNRSFPGLHQIVDDYRYIGDASVPESLGGAIRMGYLTGIHL